MSVVGVLKNRSAAYMSGGQNCLNMRCGCVSALRWSCPAAGVICHSAYLIVANHSFGTYFRASYKTQTSVEFSR